MSIVQWCQWLFQEIRRKFHFPVTHLFACRKILSVQKFKETLAPPAALCALKPSETFWNIPKFNNCEGVTWNAVILMQTLPFSERTLMSHVEESHIIDIRRWKLSSNTHIVVSLNSLLIGSKLANDKNFVVVSCPSYTNFEKLRKEIHFWGTRKFLKENDMYNGSQGQGRTF